MALGDYRKNDKRMEKLGLVVAACLMWCATVRAQEQPRQLKGGGHLLRETATQFFSEGRLGELLEACLAADWKSVSLMSKSSDRSTKSKAKDICAKAILARQQAKGGERVEYAGGDDETLRRDTFLLDGGHLVKIDMVFSVPTATLEGSHPKSFADLIAGLQEAYGAPTKAYTEVVVNAYGVKYDARRALWMGKSDVISIIEQPGADGWTEIIAETIEEHNRRTQVPKAMNPLQ